MSGVRVAVPYALISAFTAEMIAGGGGLGGNLVYAQRFFETTTVFTILIVMLAAGWLADKLQDDGCRAQSLRAMGHVFLVRGKYSEAL